jgi:predicted ATP-grasp superfamily ATP-dependent carboligase
MNGLCVLTVCKTPQGLSRYSRYSAGVWALDASPYHPEFLDEIEKLARRFDAGSIMTISEANHLAFIEGRDRFEPDIHVFSPPGDAFKKVLDKEYMRNLCERIGVPVAKGMVLADFLETPGQEMRYPRIMRTRHLHEDEGRSRAPWKVVYPTNEREFEERVEEIRQIADNVLVEECHPGPKHNINVLMHEGRSFFDGAYLAEICYPAAGGVGVQRVSYESGRLLDHAIQLLTEVGFEGNASVSFIHDLDTDDYIFIEINPRFVGSTPTVVRAGFDVAFLLWQSHFEPHKMIKPRYRLGVRTRDVKGSVAWLWQMLAGDPVEPWRKQPSKVEALAYFLWHSGPWTYADAFLWRDPKPYFVERLGMIGAPLRWAKRRKERYRPIDE